MRRLSQSLIAITILLSYSTAWGEKYTGQSTSIQSEHQTEQDRRDISPVDSDREIRMIMINQQLNKKGNAVNQLTNEVKSTHSTEQSIINNLK